MGAFLSTFLKNRKTKEKTSTFQNITASRKDKNVAQTVIDSCGHCFLWFAFAWFVYVLIKNILWTYLLTYLVVVVVFSTKNLYILKLRVEGTHENPEIVIIPIYRELIMYHVAMTQIIKCHSVHWRNMKRDVSSKQMVIPRMRCCFQIQ